MSAHTAEITRLLHRAWLAGRTPEGIALAEEAVRVADAAEDVKSGFRARCDLMGIAVFSGFYEKVILAFTWCLARADERPNEFSCMELLWKYKWVIDHLRHFPGISREQILSSLEDFRARCLKAGYNERPALFLRWQLDLHMGNVEIATENFSKWKLTKRDGMADCRACEINQIARFHAAIGKHEQAIKHAGRIFEGRLFCAEIPHLTHAALLRSFWATGQREAAQEHHLKGYRLVRGNRDFIHEQALHMTHLLRSNQLEEAAAVLRKHLPWALETKSLDLRFYFLVPARACVALLLDSGLRSLRSRVPEGVFPEAKKTTLPLPQFAAWLDQSIPELASRFDQRNGTRSFATFAETFCSELDR
jgi:hypothetical protein